MLCLAAYGQTARVVLRWKASAGMVSYQLQIARDTGFSQIVLDEKVKDPVLKWESLPSTTFFWRVRSFDGEGRASEWSAPRQISPATGPPAPKLPADGATFTCSAEPISLWLETSSVLKEYVLELSPDGRFTPADTTTLRSPDGQFQAALPAGAISWRGRGVDLTGRDTEPSAPRKLNVKLPPPKLKATPDVAPGASSVTLAWSGSPCAKRYVVEASHETPERAVHEAQDTAMSFKPAGVGEYRFRVAARDDKGNQSEWSAEGKFQVRLPAPIARFETLGKPGANGSDVELAWNAAAQASGYQVEVGKGESFSSPSTATVGALTHKLTLTPGKYLWRVAARDAAGHLSFFSEPRGFIVPDAAPPPKVALLFPVDGAILVRPADGLIGVTWPKAGSAVTHELEVDGAARPVGAPPTKVELADGDHVLRIRAVGPTGKVSDWSSEVHFFFGGPQVVSATVAFSHEPLRTDGASTTRVELRLLDPRGHVVPGAKPVLTVDRGALANLRPEADAWVADWRAPAELPPSRTATLTVEAGRYKADHSLRLAADFAPFTLAAVVGGRFNFGAVASPAGAVTLAWRAYRGGGRPTVHLRAGVYGAAATV